LGEIKGGRVGRMIGRRIEHSILGRELDLRAKVTDNILKIVDLILEGGYLVLYLFELSVLC
jgi:hypothetical protein